MRFVQVSFAILELLEAALVAAHGNFPLSWSPKTYGPDGPWQAIKVRAGGWAPATQINVQSDEVDLYPGGTYSSFILDPRVCHRFPSNTCGSGGTWRVEGPSAYPLSSSELWDEPALNRTGGTSNQYHIQALTINDKTVWNASLVVVWTATTTLPNGADFGPFVGQLALGGDTTTQNFTKPVTLWDEPLGNDAEEVAVNVFPGALYEEGIIPSYSYGLHIGSAAHGYVGSLVFGGYDRGRVIGPYTTFSESSISLLHISIGVEAGVSPFPFESKKGLLVNNQSIEETVTIRPDPTVPYLHLPGKTCETIADLLPVTLDPDIGYYMWNTDDPLFEHIVSSPAYLSFTFPPASGATEDVVIKVPFSLLNLTLDRPIVEPAKPYFPCRAFNPGKGDHYRLGRAFLQAAFIGRNWNTKISWLAQAPGPGIEGQGLGVELRDIPDRATSIDYFDPEGKFVLSWSDHWKQLTAEDVDTLGPRGSEQSQQRSGGLSIAAKVGAGVGGGIGALCLLGMIIYIVRWRKKRPSQHGEGYMWKDEPHLLRTAPVHEAENTARYELPNAQLPCEIYTPSPKERTRPWL
jgi:hypothetical protein